MRGPVVCLGSDDFSEGSHDSVFGNEFGMTYSPLVLSEFFESLSVK